MKLFVWDFHGVLEKGNDHAVLEISNMALEMHGHARRLTYEECERFAGLKWIEYFTHMLPDLPDASHLELHASCLEITKNRPELVSKHICLNDHAYDVLEQIDRSHCSQILISNCAPHVLDWFVSHLRIEKFFPPQYRFGVDAPHQHASKQECLKNFLEKNSFPEGVVTIGDSPSDMQLAELHPRSVRYMYTYPGRFHREADCHYKIHDLRHVLKEIQQRTNSRCSS